MCEQTCARLTSDMLAAFGRLCPRWAAAFGGRDGGAPIFDMTTVPGSDRVDGEGCSCCEVQLRAVSSVDAQCSKFLVGSEVRKSRVDRRAIR